MSQSESRKQRVLALRDLYLDLARSSQAEQDNVTIRELRQLIEFASASSLWWNNYFLHADRGTDSLSVLLESLPIMTRSFVQDNLAAMQLQVPGASQNDYIVHKTSGSTGQPVQVRKHATSYFMEYDAITLLDWAWHKRDIAKVVGGFRIDAEEQQDAVTSAPLSYLGKAPNQFSLSALARSPKELVAGLAKHKAAYVYSNGVTIRLAALEQLENPQAGLKLEQFLSVSDPVSPGLRELVRDAFGAKICNRYSSEEFGYIALQCPVHDHMHVIAPSVHVEVVDEHGRACSEGEVGRVLVTALHSFAMPLVRYAIGDFAMWGSPCDAGITWPVIENVMGRERNTIVGSDGQSRIVSLIGMSILSNKKLRDYQVVVLSESILFVANVREPFDSFEISDLESELQNIFRRKVPVHVLLTDHIKWRSAVKRSEFDVLNVRFDEIQNLTHLEKLLSSSDLIP